MNTSPLLSIIIPVYNAEKYLQKCVNSIFEQDFSDYELILVNDGSTDGSGDICDKYALIDPRIQVIHKANGGQSSARNNGLKAAKGKYLWFIDSDDIIEANCISTLIQEIEGEELDYLEFPAKSIHLDGSTSFSSMEKRGIGIVSGRELIQHCFLNLSPCYSITQRALWIDNKITFLEGVYAEDLQCNIRLFKHVKKYKFTEENIYPYIYQIHEGSTSQEKNNDHIRKYLSSYFKILYSWKDTFDLETKDKHSYDYWVNRKYINYLKCCILACLYKSHLDKKEKLTYYKRFKDEKIFLRNLRGRGAKEDFVAFIFYRTFAVVPLLYKLLII